MTQEYTITFNQDELQTVVNALGTLPYGQIAPLVDNIKDQYNNIVNPPTLFKASQVKVVESAQDTTLNSAVDNFDGLTPLNG
jgi:hypothetical protein